MKGTLAYVKGLGGDVLELERCFGISLLWLFSRWGPLLDRLPLRVARVAWLALDAVAYRIPALADMMVSVWRRRDDAAS